MLGWWWAQEENVSPTAHIKDHHRVHIASPGTPGGSWQLSNISIVGKLWHFGQTPTWPCEPIHTWLGCSSISALSRQNGSRL